MIPELVVRDEVVVELLTASPELLIHVQEVEVTGTIDAVRLLQPFEAGTTTA